jgi:hypothetical protein
MSLTFNVGMHTDTFDDSPHSIIDREFSIIDNYPPTETYEQTRSFMPCRGIHGPHVADPACNICWREAAEGIEIITAKQLAGENPS